MEKSNNKKLFVIVFLIGFALINIVLFAQDKKSELDSKLDQLKGSVEKITVKVDGKEVVFEGDDAERLSKGLKFFSKKPHMTWTSVDEDFESGDGKVMMYKFHGDDKDADSKEVEVKIEDGKKIVKVTTTKDGKEETKVYEGEEAEKFLKENEKGDKFKIHINSGESEDGDVVFFSNKGGGDCCCSCMHMKHFPMHGKGIKKIIIEKEGKGEKKDGSE